jgi:hypothetical protein
MNRALWIVQGLLAPLFLFAGAAKLVMPLDEMVAESGMPGWFILFLGVVEVLGAIGLILPALLKIRPGLTPLAAAGLLVIMVGATVLTAAGVGGGDPIVALFPLVVGVLTAFVAYGRWQVAPRSASRQTVRLQPAAF